MLTKENLNKLAQDIIPEPYSPGKASILKPGDTWPILTDVAYMKEETFYSMLRRYCPSKDPDSVQAFCMNWGLVMRTANKEDWKDFTHSHSIALKPGLDIPVLALSFIILHEVGHIHWKNSPEKRLTWASGNEELFADMYAYDQMGGLYGDWAATKAIVQYGHIEGAYKVINEGKQCPT